MIERLGSSCAIGTDGRQWIVYRARGLKDPRPNRAWQGDEWMAVGSLQGLRRHEPLGRPRRHRDYSLQPGELPPDDDLPPERLADHRRGVGRAMLATTTDELPPDRGLRKLREVCEIFKRQSPLSVPGGEVEIVEVWPGSIAVVAAPPEAA